MSDTWIVPGAPLANGAGWRIWYSRAGTEDLNPGPIEVFRAGRPVPFQGVWRQLPAQLPLKPETAADATMNRRMGVLTVTLDQPEPGALYEIRIPEAGRAMPFQWRTMPSRVTDAGVTFLFASCFSLKDDKAGKYGAAVDFLTKSQGAGGVAFKLLIGDQIYQDWPPVLFFKKSDRLKIYVDRYAAFWGDEAYRQALQACPNFFLCDDHEYWNDYPEQQTQLPITYSLENRIAFGDIADTLYHYYQRCLNPDEGRWYRFDIDPVSFFVADGRSERDLNAAADPHFFQQAQWSAIEQWATDLHGPGVFVIGQPPYQKDGDSKDHSLSNFPKDYARLWRIFADAQGRDGRTPHNILVLSGDIHMGRFATGTLLGVNPGDNQFGVIREFIASPSSLLTPDSLGKKDPPPAKMPAQNPIVKDIFADKTEMTTDNNIAAVRISPGTNGRIRFDLTLWRVCPYDGLNYFKRAWDAIAHRQADIIKIFEKTNIQLK